MTVDWSKRPPRLRYFVRVRERMVVVEGDEVVLDTFPELTVEYWHEGGRRKGIASLPHEYESGAKLLQGVRMLES